MSNAWKTVLSCPCCRMILAATETNTAHWKRKTDKEFHKFKNYLNVALSSNKEPMVTKGTQMAMTSRAPTGFSEEERNSLLYQMRFINARKTMLNDLVRIKQLEVPSRSCYVTPRYSINESKLPRLPKRNGRTKNRSVLPKLETCHENPEQPGSTVVKFEDETVKLDVFLPPLT